MKTRRTVTTTHSVTTLGGRTERLDVEIIDKYENGEWMELSDTDAYDDLELQQSGTP